LEIIEFKKFQFWQSSELPIIIKIFSQDEHFNNIKLLFSMRGLLIHKNAAICEKIPLLAFSIFLGFS
jgi:hypothetical protein